jgi:chromosome segregation ATPase
MVKRIGIKITRQMVVGIVAFVLIAGCLIDAGAQRRRHRRRRPATPRITNPAITAPADSASAATESGTATDNQTGAEPKADDPTEMRRTIRSLSTQVDKLNEKLSEMQESQRSMVDLERLTRAEQRGEGLRAQLRDVQEKETQVQARADEIEYALQPANIERAVAMYGTTHPEEAREQRRKQLEAEKAKVRAQLDTLEQSRARLETAIAAADVEVDRLKEKIDAADAAAIQNAKSGGQAAGTNSAPAQTYPSPTPSPSP